MANVSEIVLSEFFTTETPTKSVEENPAYFNYLNLATLSVGIVANFSLLVVSFLEKITSRQGMLLFRSQTVSDLLALLFFMVIYFIPGNDYTGTGIQFIDDAICYLWKMTNFVWICLFWSAWNMALISFERYVAVCTPLEHSKLSLLKLWVMIIIAILVSIVFDMFPYVGASSFNPATQLCDLDYYYANQNRILHTVYASGIFWKVAYLIWVLISYVFPVGVMVFFYGKCIISLRSKREVSTTFDRAQNKFIQIMIICSVIFLISNAFNAFIWTFEFVFPIVSIYSSGPARPIVRFLSNYLSLFNCCANPFIYFGSSFISKIRQKRWNESSRKSIQQASSTNTYVTGCRNV